MGLRCLPMIELRDLRIITPISEGDERGNMNDGLQWLPNAYSEGFSVIFCAGESADGLLRKIGASPARILPLTSGEAEAITVFNYDPDGIDLEGVGLDEAGLRERGFLHPDAAVLRAGAVDGWAFAIQNLGTYSAETKMNEMASVGTRCVSYSQTINADIWVQYSENGQIVDAFDPLAPGNADPQWLLRAELLTADDEDTYVLSRLESSFGLYVPVDEGSQRLPAASFIEAYSPPRPTQKVGRGALRLIYQAGTASV